MENLTYASVKDKEPTFIAMTSLTFASKRKPKLKTFLFKNISLTTSTCPFI
jgi:hypothetical protein